MFLLVLAYPGCPGSKAVKRSLLLLLFIFLQAEFFGVSIEVAVFMLHITVKIRFYYAQFSPLLLASKSGCVLYVQTNQPASFLEVTRRRFAFADASGNKNAPANVRLQTRS